MSLKPTKVTDLNKAWLKKRETRKKISINPEYHLFVTEGTKTEPNYFEAVKNEINEKYKGRISLEIEGTGFNTVSLVKKAQELVQSSPNIFKHVWVVYDKDDFSSEQFNKAAELCGSYSTSETKYHALWSNQCIELWFLLHFGYYQSDITREEYYPKLSEHLCQIGAGEYKKNRDDIYSVLKPYLKKAVKNAKKLAQINVGKTPTESAPGTEVYRFIEELEDYLDLKQ